MILNFWIKENVKIEIDNNECDFNAEFESSDLINFSKRFFDNLCIIAFLLNFSYLKLLFFFVNLIFKIIY